MHLFKAVIFRKNDNSASNIEISIDIKLVFDKLRVLIHATFQNKPQ